MQIKMRKTEFEKCPCCNWKVDVLFGFEKNPDDEMLCGRCFSQMLVEDGFEVEKISFIGDKNGKEQKGKNNGIKS